MIEGLKVDQLPKLIHFLLIDSLANSFSTGMTFNSLGCIILKYEITLGRVLPDHCASEYDAVAVF